MSSFQFAGDATSYLNITNNSANDLALGTGDFTIEWYINETDSNSFPRHFSIGSYDTVPIIAMSNEGTIYFWHNGSPDSLSYDGNTIRNNWRHFAIVRASGVINVYIDGVSVLSQSNTESFGATYNLCIGNETIVSSDTAFGGDMLYFHWVKGFAKYTSDFTSTDTIPASIVGFTKLLVTSTAITGDLAPYLNNVNVLNLVDPPPRPTPSDPIYSRFKSLFTNNSQVYYKPGSMGSTSGVGGVGNYRKKAKFT